MFLVLAFIFGARVGHAQANVQLIHNSPDPVVDTVDIYVNGVKVDSNLVYLAATTFLPWPNGVPLNVAICYKHSFSQFDTIRTFQYDSLTYQANYIFIISGVYHTDLYASNPDGRSTALNFQIVKGALTSSIQQGRTSYAFVNGVTDCYGLDVVQRGGGSLLENNVKYGDVEGYNTDDAWYFDWTMLKEDSTEYVGIWSVVFAPYGNQSPVIFTSGFLHPDSNNEGPLLRLFMAFNWGQVLEITPHNAALQLVHNSADEALDTVDVYVNGKKTYASLPFRTSTPVLTERAELPFQMSLAPKNSTSVAQAFWSSDDSLVNGKYIIRIMQGLMQSGYAQNPDGINTAFEVLEKTDGRLTPASPTDFDFFFMNGVTDAGAVNLKLEDGPVILTGAAYNEPSSYFSFVPGDFIFDINDSSSGNLAGSYPAHFSAFQGQTGIVLTSGFSNPQNNNNGAASNLYLVTKRGGSFIPFGPAMNVKQVEGGTEIKLYPNPAANNLNITISVTEPDRVSIDICDLSGRALLEIANEITIFSNNAFNANLGQFQSGMYLVRIKSKTSVNTLPLVLTK